jgi:hypothetical protein
LLISVVATIPFLLKNLFALVLSTVRFTASRL